MNSSLDSMGVQDVRLMGGHRPRHFLLNDKTLKILRKLGVACQRFNLKGENLKFNYKLETFGLSVSQMLAGIHTR